ncbi:MAG: response regulator [Fuerstiella sp.]|nr:response regulator [Fuerstiella sp.]
MSTSRPRLLVSGDVDNVTSDLCRNLSDFVDIIRTEKDQDSSSIDGVLFTGTQTERSADLQICAQGFLDSVAVGLALVDDHHRVVWHNQVFAEISRDGQPLTGLPFFESVDADEDNIALLRRKWPDGGRSGCCVTIQLSSRRYVEALASCAQLPTPEGISARFTSVCLRDITQQELARRKSAAIHDAGMRLSDLRPDEVAMMSNEDRIEILKENILTFSQQILGFDTIEIRLLDPATQQLVPLLQEGMQDEAACRMLYARQDGNGLTGYVAATGRSYLCADTQSESRYLRGAEYARSSLTVPLRLDDVILGTFNVEGPGADTFDEADLEFLEHFGAVVAMALNQLQLMMAEKATTAEQHVTRLQQQVAGPTDDILTDATSILEKYIGHDPDVSETLQRILTKVRQIRSCIGEVTEVPTEDTAVPQPRLHRSLRSDLIRKRVLVVDSDPAVRAEAHKLLDPQGCVVEAVPTGAAACRMMRSQTYDVVLADIRLSDMTGFECFISMRDIDTHTPVIFMTGFGYDASHSIVKARQHGLKAVLYKPFRVEQLLTEIEKAIATPPPLE